MHHQRVWQEKAVQTEIQLAHRMFVQSVPRRPADLPFQWGSSHHHCDEACDLFCFRNTSICKATGNLHYCTSETCDRMIRRSDMMVCELSGTTYELELVFATCYRGGYDDHDMDYDEVEVVEAHGVVADANHPHTEVTAEQQLHHFKMQHKHLAEQSTLASDWHVDVIPELPSSADAECAMLPAMSPGCAAEADVSSRVLSDKYNRIAIFHSLLTKIFKTPIECEHKQLFQSIAHNAERLWILIHTSSVFKRESQRYQVEYHLLVVVYFMCAGYGTLRQPIVPYNHWIAEHMPQVRDLKRVTITKGSVKVNNYTAASKLFKRSFIDIVQHGTEETKSRLAWTETHVLTSTPRERSATPAAGRA
jgi:hypothetical protein